VKVTERYGGTVGVDVIDLKIPAGPLAGCRALRLRHDLDCAHGRGALS
jgi:hypothetical protein